MKNKARPEVLVFADAMEAKLRRNDRKGGWHNCDRGYLRRRLRTELRELFVVLDELTKLESKLKPTGLDDQKHQRLVSQLLGECVDVANFAMMVADTNGVLNQTRVDEISKRKP